MPGKGSAKQRGYGEAWKRLRIAAFQLYGRTCHLCGLPGADTLDHLDPVSRHGTYTPDISRVRPAHQACNSRRGNKPIARARSPRSRIW